MQSSKLKFHLVQVINEWYRPGNLYSAVNNSSNYYPIHQFSSGGELSRIALAMKSLTSIKGIVIYFDF